MVSFIDFTKLRATCGQNMRKQTTIDFPSKLFSLQVLACGFRCLVAKFHETVFNSLSIEYQLRSWQCCLASLWRLLESMPLIPNLTVCTPLKIAVAVWRYVNNVFRVKWPSHRLVLSPWCGEQWVSPRAFTLLVPVTMATRLRVPRSHSSLRLRPESARLKWAFIIEKYMRRLINSHVMSTGTCHKLENVQWVHGTCGWVPKIWKCCFGEGKVYQCILRS